MNLPDKILIGVSACLLGEKVRFDGGHKKDKLITGTLAKYVDYYPVCPEAEVGLGIPRPPIRLVGNSEDPQVVEVKDPTKNYTKLLKQYSKDKVETLPPVSAFILKSKSPSCGMERVKVYQADGKPSQPGQGVFAAALLQRFTALPTEEEGRLNDPRLRENFIERLFIYRRWQELENAGLTKKSLVSFHANIKLTLMSHNVAAYKRLGRKMADLKNITLKSFAKIYITELMVSLKKVASTKNHSNVLYHTLGYLKKSLSKAEKQALVDVIEEYRLELVPLIVPMTLLRHYFDKYPNEYLLNQTYLNPYPKEFMLRNAV